MSVKRKCYTQTVVVCHEKRHTYILVNDSRPTLQTPDIILHIMRSILYIWCREFVSQRRLNSPVCPLLFFLQPVCLTEQCFNKEKWSVGHFKLLNGWYRVTVVLTLNVACWDRFVVLRGDLCKRYITKEAK